jgi:Uma2 family endonuclease
MRRVTKVPLLVVEVLSPSSRLIDPVLKRAKYAEHRVPSYWIADPAGPSLTVLELDGADYIVRAELGPDDQVHLDSPYPMDLHLRLEA